jgi:AraC family transcriptional regulator of adaptative response/methylated-DNA-[protein]-cysteine methyltransferase
MAPARYALGGAAQAIMFAIVPSVLGQVLVAMTQRGICAVRLGDDASLLEQELRREFPNAEIQRADGGLESATSKIVAYLAGEGPWPRLPLDARGTAFQRRVWDALLDIQSGTTTTYGELARALGDPNAARAVASACAANPVALLIPCHRVLPKDEHGGGYRWGTERKRVLLEREAKPR